MIRTILAAATATMMIGGVALAQSPSGAGITQQGRTSQPPLQVPGQPAPAETGGQQPVFSVLGVPAYVTAPVAAPYSNSAYETNGGQPDHSSEPMMQGVPSP